VLLWKLLHLIKKAVLPVLASFPSVPQTTDVYINCANRLSTILKNFILLTLTFILQPCNYISCADQCKESYIFVYGLDDRGFESW